MVGAGEGPGSTGEAPPGEHDAAGEAEGERDVSLASALDLADYIEQRKRELYQTAVQSAVKDEKITDKERDVLGASRGAEG